MKTILQIEERSRLFDEVITSCQYILKNDPIAGDARKYLDSRIPKNFQDKFQFGYFPNNDYLTYLTSLVDKNILKDLGLAYQKVISGGSFLTGHFANHNLIFPFRDMYGNIVSIVGRTLFDKEKQDELQIPKYKYSFGLNKELYLFGLNDAKEHIISKNYVIPVEGQFDYFSCICNGIHNVVALGGAACSIYQFFKLRRYTNNFVIFLDNDEAGKRASEKIRSRFGSYANIQVKYCNGFKDLDEFLNNADIDRRNGVIHSLQSLKME
jgi:DNA primase